MRRRTGSAAPHVAPAVTGGSGASPEEGVVADLDLRLLVASTDPAELPALVGRLREAELLAEMRLRDGFGENNLKPAETEVNISAAEAARRLGMSTHWLYRNAGTLPFVARIGRRVVCSASGLERFQKKLGGGNGSR
jgi:hypothetical protein